MRPIQLTVGGKEIGWALTWAYPNGADWGFFKIPTYELRVAGVDNSKHAISKTYEVLRFGVKCGKKGENPYVVGLAKQQTRTIRAWLPNYTVHSAQSVERGAWQVKDNFLIHDGPDAPHKEVYASVGCIEICHGPRGFDRFNDLIISISGSKKKARDEQLMEIGQSRNIRITYEKAERPSIQKVPRK